MDDDMLVACGCTHNDTEGVINLPLTAREIQAVVFFKVVASGDVRVSMRSKYDVDVRLVAGEHGGGGHKNAAGFTVPGPLAEVRPRIIARLVQSIAEATRGLEHAD
jgi:phosphoesterase RecJ-like protein